MLNRRTRYASLLVMGGVLQQQSCLPADYLPALGLGLVTTIVNAVAASAVTSALATA